MTIELSLVLWTLISFAVFWLLLDRILFRPLLRVMHAREDKIRKGKEAAASADAALASAEKAGQEDLEACRRKAASDAADAVKAAAAAREARLNQAHKTAEEAYQAGLAQLHRDETACEAALTGQIPALAALAADTLTGKNG